VGREEFALAMQKPARQLVGQETLSHELEHESRTGLKRPETTWLEFPVSGFHGENGVWTDTFIHRLTKDLEKSCQ